MTAGFRIHLIVITVLFLGCCAGPVSGAGIGTAWKEPLITDSPFAGVRFAADDSTVFAGGNQMFVRTWDRERHWGGRAGTFAAMSTDGNYFVSGLGKSFTLLYYTGIENWTRSMGAPIRAVAVSRNGSLVIAADDDGYISSWKNSGEFIARNKTDLAKNIAVSPTGNLVVMASEGGLMGFSPVMTPLWTDNRSGSLDTYILFSADGSTIITAGGTRVSSHTSSGDRTWVEEVTGNAIIDIACSEDCSVIVIGSQDSTVQALDRYGKIHWSYPAGHWVNAVGIAGDGSVIAAGSVDQNLYILDHGGNLLAKKKMESIIQQRSVAVSRSGERIALADQYNLYGLELFGITDLPETVATRPRPTVTQETTLPAPATPPPATTPAVQPTPLPTPSPTGTPASPLSPVYAVLAAGAAGLMVYRRMH